MSQSLSHLVCHIIFSTKNRRPLILPEIREELHAYFVGILESLDSRSFLINSVADHVHILCALSKNHSLAKVMEEIKKGTSKWIKTKSPTFGDFYWQNGYGAFSVSQSNAQEVMQCIAGQEAHHRKVSFQDEYRAFLKKHEVEFDERYVWD